MRLFYKNLDWWLLKIQGEINLVRINNIVIYLFIMNIYNKDKNTINYIIIDDLAVSLMCVVLQNKKNLVARNSFIQ